MGTLSTFESQLQDSEVQKQQDDLCIQTKQTQLKNMLPPVSKWLQNQCAVLCFILIFFCIANKCKKNRLTDCTGSFRKRALHIFSVPVEHDQDSQFCSENHYNANTNI